MNRKGISKYGNRFPLLKNKTWLEDELKIKCILQISEEIGCSYIALRKRIKKYGISIGTRHTPRAGRNIDYSKLRDKEWLKNEYVNKPIQEIARDLGCSRGAVDDWLKKHELISIKRTTKAIKFKGMAAHKGAIGSRASNWKGGIRNNYGAKGYRAIYSPNHPYKSKEGYVMEHRLVMEKYLGRYLNPGELVHHRNQNVKDNRIENLEIVDKRTHHFKHNKKLSTALS